MKKNSIVLSILLVLVLLAPTTLVRADTPAATQNLSLVINGSALLAIKNVGSISLTLSGASEAGGAIQTSASDSTTRLLITNLVDDSITSRNVTAKISAVPTGSNLILSVLPPSTTFASGNYGTLLSGVVLTTANKSIITGIGTCWSGTSADSGYMIKYTYQMIAGATTLAGAAVTVTYTLAAPV